MVQVREGKRPGSCVPAVPWNSSTISGVILAPCSMVSTPALSDSSTPSVLSTWAMTGRPRRWASAQAALATSRDILTTPGSPAFVASKTPPVTKSLTTSTWRPERSRTMAAASSGELATWANRPAPWPWGAVMPVPGARILGPSKRPDSMASRATRSP